ncbi:MAG: AMP-binding protein [Pseudomonadota bacterium]
MNVGHFLASAARSFPGHPAISVGTERRASYAQFMLRVSRLAAALRGRLNLQPGDRVGLAMKNCPQYLEALYAIWHAGLCAVPMNAKLHAREFGHILHDTAARLCFVTADLAEPLASLVGELPDLRQLVCVDDREYELLFHADALDLQAVADDSPAWLFYTSGTTGRPKGAMLSHRALRGMALRYYADIDQLSEADSMLHAAPFSHAGGLFALPHMARASHQVIPASQGFDPAEISELTHHHDNMALFAAPTMLTRMVDHPSIGRARLDAIRTIVYGGAPMYVEDIKRALQTIGPRLLGGYGQGEMPNTITGLPKRMHADASHPDYEQRLASAGIARTGVEVRVVDDSGRDLAPGEVGEVIARSDVCMTGYWRNPEATAHALRDGWLYTGDLGCLSADGFLTLKDRSKDLIISGGSNIYPREVEEVLLLHPDVLEVSVVGRRHADWGEEVVAFVVPRAGKVVTGEALDSICLANIARFKRPKSYRFIEALPKSNYGKVLKTELRSRLSRQDDQA